MSFKANGPRASPQGAATLAALARPRLQRRPHRGLGLALLCIVCYSLLRAAQGVLWAANLRRSGSCQADNEVGGSCRSTAAGPASRLADVLLHRGPDLPHTS